MEQEIWKETEIPGYFISNYGRLKGRSDKIIKAYMNKKTGYYQLCLKPNGRDGKSKAIKIHRLVAKAFVKNPNNYTVINHIDGNKANNYFENLEWCTNSRNTKHAYDLGLNKAKIGPDNSKAKLTKAQVQYLKEKYIPRDKEFGARAFARRFNVPHSKIVRILQGKYYKNC